MNSMEPLLNILEKKFSAWMKDRMLKARGYISKIKFIWKTVIKNVLNLVFSPIKIIVSDILQSFDMCDIATAP